jgi:calnexin
MNRNYRLVLAILIIASILNLNVHGQSISDDDDFDDDSSSSSSSSSSQSSSETKPLAEKPKYVRPVVKDFYFLDPFDDLKSIGKKWIKSIAKKEGVDEDLAKYDGEWDIEEAFDSVIEGDLGLGLKSKARHHAISARLVKPFVFTHKKPLIVQYEVKFQTPLECGGAYVKLLADQSNMDTILKQFHDKTSFSIMFGPDKCGTDIKYHLIIRFRHPVKGTYEEKHAKKSQVPDNIFSDGKTHLYTLILRPDNTFHMLIDDLEINTGNLLTDLTPPIIPDKIISDPNDKKPETWDDREKIQDPDAVKPEDWDEDEPKTIVNSDAFMPEGWIENEEETIPDPMAAKPEDWDADTDGEWEAPRIENPQCKNAPGCGKWEAPQIPNPKYKGKWKAPYIENVNYQGKWEARKIDNPDYFELDDPFTALTSFSAIGLELWSMTENILFDNFIIADSEEIVKEFTKDTWVVKKDLESAKSGSGVSVNHLA